MSSSYIQTPSCQWMNQEQSAASCKLSNSSSSLQDEYKLDSLSWGSWHDQQEQLDTPSANRSSKFFVDMDENEQDYEQEEDCYSATWSFSSFDDEDDLSTSENEQELHFVKKMDDQYNPIYTTTTATVKKPISLLTQMLNGNTPAPPQQQQQQQQQKQPLLKRCQSKYQSLSSWFATSTTAN